MKLDISQELPFLFGDRERIHQVMTNLLGNAIKFSFEGGEIRIRVDPKTKHLPVLIISMVEDERRGILLGANEYLVKPFREGDLAKKVLKDGPVCSRRSIRLSCLSVTAHRYPRKLDPHFPLPYTSFVF